MRTPLRVAVIILLIVIIVGAAGFGYGLATIKRSWPQIDGAIQIDGLHDEVTVIRDSWGVPHIYASNSHDLHMAQGYVHAQDRFWQMEFWRRIGEGRLSEILGESSLGSDSFIRTVGWHRAAAAELTTLDQELTQVLESYSEGVNAYISTHQGQLGLEFTILGLIGTEFEPEPWTPLNTLTWAKVMCYDLGGNMDTELVRAQIASRLGVDAVQDLMPLYPESHPVIVPEPVSAASIEAVPEVALDSQAFGSNEYVGSNNWVVSGSRTETGMPILADDTHLGIRMPSIWYEVGLHCDPVGPDCPFNVAGFSFAGVPGVIIGHNDDIAWGVTNLGPDVQDLFIERVNPENPNQYEYQGEWLDMEIVREEILVAGQDEPVVVNARITRHGPIINDIVGGAEDGWEFGWQPLALSWTALEPGTLMRSVLLLNQASNWDEFRDALSYWDTPSQNFVYADREGNIGYQSPGRIPIRAAGDGTMPVPGWSGEYDWVGYIPFDELPRTFNPSAGYVATANNAVVGPDYPYLLSMDWAPGYRAQRISEMIEADASISIADIQAIHGNNYSVYAREVLPYLLDVAPSEPRLSQAIELLRDWDGQKMRDSAAAALFESFRLHLVDATFGDETGDDLLRRIRSNGLVALVDLLAEPNSPWFDDVTTPGVETRDDIILFALGDAVDELSTTLGEDMGDWRWGDLHTATFENESVGQCGIGIVESLFNRGPVPVDGSSGTVNATSYSTGAPYTVRGVPSQRMIVDLGDLTNSLSMHTTGQSGHPFHPHYDDMIDPWRNIEYHPFLWERADVEADAEGTLLLTP